MPPLLDEATAAAEAMAMARRISKVRARLFVDEGVFPQTLDVVRTRADYFGFELIVGPRPMQPTMRFWCTAQYPNERGEVTDISAAIAGLKAKGAVAAVASDLMALVLLRSPGALGADIALGSAQRFNVPLGFGGPTRPSSPPAKPCSLHARSHHRRIQDTRSQDCPAHGPANPRATHPPRRPTQHLHLPGAARQHGLDVRRVPRAGRTAHHRRAHPPPAATLAAGLRQAGFTPRLGLLLRHLQVTGAADRCNLCRRPLPATTCAACGRPVRSVAIDEKTTGDDIAALLAASAGRPTCPLWTPAFAARR